MLENNLNERLLNDNATILEDLGITENIQNILNQIHFTINEKNEIVNAGEIAGQTFTRTTWNALDTLSEGTFHLADERNLFSLYKQLIDHQLRIIQYYRLFNRFQLLNMLNDNERRALENYKTELERVLPKHDSDKLDDKNIMKYYLSQEYLSNVRNITEELKFVFNKISAALRRVHGDKNSHHNEYYNYKDHDINGITAYLVLEHVIDVMSIADKNLEIIGQFYNNKKQQCFANFAIKNNDLITNIYNAFKENIFNYVETQKPELEQLKKDKNHLVENKVRIEGLKQEISRQTEEIVWQNMNDGKDDQMKITKELCKNVYFAIEEEWSKAGNNKEQKDDVLNNFSIISDYKNRFFEQNIDLRRELSNAVENNDERSKKIIKISAILETLNNLEQNNNIDNDFANQEDIRTKRDYIRQRNRERGDTFYVASIQ